MVTSPIQVVSQINVKDAKLIRIELRREDGRLLSRVLKSPSVFPWSSATLSFPLLFEIRAPEEPALLSISAEDLYGRVIALNTSMITLVKNSGQKLVDAQSDQVPITIREPIEGEIISGGILTVTGAAEPGVTFPLRIELISTEGKLLGHKWTRDSRNDDRSFNEEVLYTAASGTPVRLVVYSKENRGDLILYLNSIEIILNP
jgi:hypothetical protein